MTTILFNEIFQPHSLLDIYFTEIQSKKSIGIDKINRQSFEKRLNENINTINRKVLNGTYLFTCYKLKLISKGRNKTPRIISVPTIRDKITLRTLSLFLSELYSKELKHSLVQPIINDLKISLKSGIYDSYLRIDIENFYPSINHEILLNKIKKKVKKPEIISLIIKALTTKTVSLPKEIIQKPKKGVPQGLSISNVLSSIYLLDLDSKYKNFNDFKYFRYVDDILILCNKNTVENIKKNISEELKLLELKINNDKSDNGSIYDKFSYLGYLNTEKGFSVRESTVAKLKDSIVKIISRYKYANTGTKKALLWKLNLRISGCRYGDKKYGWLFFFSQIDNIALLYELDWFVRKIFVRYNINIENLYIKRFVRTYFEITKNLSHTNYIENFNAYSERQKRKLLKEIFRIKKESKYTDDQIDIIFNDKISYTVRELQVDLQRTS